MDRALLLGAVFGDGYIQDRNSAENTYRVAVCSGNDYPAWFDSIAGIFERVFGRSPCSAVKYEREDGYRFVETYLATTLDEVWEAFGLVDKYLPGHGPRTERPMMMAPPSWVEDDVATISAFILGLTETDGSFLARRDSPSKSLVPLGNLCCDYGFFQKDTGLALWVWQMLDRHGFEPIMSWGDDSNTWCVAVKAQENVECLGTWFPFPCAKWDALLASGCRPQPHKTRRAYPLEKPPARFPRNVQVDVVEKWRAAAAGGESGSSIARRHRVRPEIVRDAVRDIRWDLHQEQIQQTREKADVIVRERRRMAPPKPVPRERRKRGWKGGSTYLLREDAVLTYSEAKKRVSEMSPLPVNWRDYLARCNDHGLPTEPKSIWPREWESGGGHAGYLGIGVVTEDLMSAEQARQYLSIGFSTWKKLVIGLEPQASVRHKKYFDPTSLREHLLISMEQVKMRSDARKRLTERLARPIGENDE